MSDQNDYGLTAEEALALQSATAANSHQKFDTDANRVFLDGTRQFPGFEQSIERLKEAGVNTPDVLLQIMESDAPARVLHHLGQEEDLATAKQLAALNPVKRAQAIAAIERGESYNFAKTATPMWKRATNDLSRDDLSDKAWSAAFDKRFGRGGMPRK
jgi:hypothetical protein